MEAIGADRRSLPSLRLIGRLEAGGAEAGSSGSAFELKETSPGRYEGFAPLSDRGLAGIEVLDPLSGSRASTWVWRSPGGESSAEGPDEAALSLIASSGGGELLRADGLSPPRPGVRWSSIAMRFPLLVLAALLFVADLYLRSTMAGQLGRALSAFAAWWAAQKALAESARLRPWPGPGPEEDMASIELREKRFMEMQRKLAIHVSRRSEKREDRDA